jgi:bifunctional DNase/RNase
MAQTAARQAARQAAPEAAAPQAVPSAASQAEDALQVEVKDMTITQSGVALTLVSDETEQELHLMIGSAEGQAIVRALRHAKLERPQTHDLMKTLVEAGGWQVVRVIIRELRANTYFADIVLERPGAFGLEGNVEEKIIDARPSDAMALGLRFDAKIYVRQSVFDAEREQRDQRSPLDPPRRRNPSEPESVTI